MDLKMLFSAIIFILKVLIKIGDFVFFLLKTLSLGVRKTSSAVRTFFSSLSISIRIKLLKLSIKASDLKLSTSQELTTQRIKRNRIKFKIRRKYLSFKKGLRKIKRFFTEPFKNVKKTQVAYQEPKKEVSFLPKLKYFSFGLVFSSIFIFFPILFFIFLQQLPNPQELTIREMPQTTKILDRNGTLLYQIYANENRTLVSLSEIPQNLKNATIAIEDKDFYKNPGFDIAAIIRAAIADLTGQSFQGGSTITQQLIKSTLLSPEISIKRKVKEIILAFWAERIYNKNQILQMYFNQVPYGGTAYGIEAASEVYFGKKVKDLDLAQSAFLAGIPKAPTIYSPYGEYPNLWKKRQREVLKRMQELGYITEKQRSDAEKENLSFKPLQTPIYAPHFVMYVKDLLVQKYGLIMVEKGGLTVRTSLDLKTQDMAEQTVKKEVLNDSAYGLSNGAALVTNPSNGDILAMVGSKDYYDQNGGKVNLTTSLRQPGSSIKAVTYAAALSHGFTAATILDDSPVTYSSAGTTYSPVNYDGRFHGKVSLRLALGNSFNIPAVKTLNTVGIPTMVNLGKEMGISSWGDPKDYGLSITLGAAEVRMTDMANVYGTLANDGKLVSVNPILKITDYKGSVIEEKTQTLGKQVLDRGVAFIISSILADNNARAIEFGLNSQLNIPNQIVSVKTGTSDEKRDNWTIGYTPSRLVAVWVGNNDNTPMSQTLASGITGAAPIWNQIMTNLLAGQPKQNQVLPENILAKKCAGYTEYFVRGTESVPCSPMSTPSATLISTQ
jgi:1A family penicillin-binding protein